MKNKPMTVVKEMVKATYFESTPYISDTSEVCTIEGMAAIITITWVDSLSK
jgi:hypothetical protein